MSQFTCMGCGYVYDEENGSPGQRVPNYNALLKTGCGWHKGQDSATPVPVDPGTKWADVPDDYICPSCGAAKDLFE